MGNVSLLLLVSLLCVIVSVIVMFVIGPFDLAKAAANVGRHGWVRMHRSFVVIAVVVAVAVPGPLRWSQITSGHYHKLIDVDKQHPATSKNKQQLTRRKDAHQQITRSNIAL